MSISENKLYEMIGRQMMQIIVLREQLANATRPPELKEPSAAPPPDKSLGAAG